MRSEQEDLCWVARDQMEHEEEQDRDSDQNRNRDQDPSRNELKQGLLHSDVVEQRRRVDGEPQTLERLAADELRVRVVERDDRSGVHDRLAELLVSGRPLRRIADPVGDGNSRVEALVAEVRPVETDADELAAEDRAERVRIDVVVEEVREVLDALVVVLEDAREPFVAEVRLHADSLELRLQELRHRVEAEVRAAHEVDGELVAALRTDSARSASPTRVVE